MGCSRPLIFLGEPRDKLPLQGRRKEALIRPSSAPRPRFFFIASLAEVAGYKLPGSRVLLVAAAPPGRSEQNRLSPPPLTVNDASEGFSFLW